MSNTNEPPDTSQNLSSWQVHPSLTEDRLLVLDTLIRKARHEAVLEHKPQFGDNGCVLGLRAFFWVCNAITQAALGEHSDWLNIVEGGYQDALTEDIITRPHFVFQIGDVPVRFYRGTPEEVPEHYLRQRWPELEALQMAMFEKELDEVFRIAVETDKAGEVVRTSLVQVEQNTGIPHRVWRIPSGKGTASVVKFTSRTDKEKKLEPATAQRRRRKERTLADDEPAE